MGRVHLSVVEEAERRMPIYQVDNDKQAIVLNCKHTPAKLTYTCTRYKVQETRGIFDTYEYMCKRLHVLPFMSL